MNARYAAETRAVALAVTLSVLLCGTGMPRVVAFAPSTTISQFSRSATECPIGGPSFDRLLLGAVKKNGSDDFPVGEDGEYKGTVDWDAEWKKVVANEGKTPDGKPRPGSDFYRSDAEIAAIKATNQAAERVSEVRYKVQRSLPSISSLTGDWKFWIGLLAVISIGISVLTAPPMLPPNTAAGGASADSYFI